MTDEPIVFPVSSVKRGGTRTASLDRIDSNGDYTIENVQWVHKDINLMKMNLPEDRFVTWCHKVSKHNAQSKNNDQAQNAL